MPPILPAAAGGGSGAEPPASEDVAVSGSHEKPARTGWGLPRPGTADAPGASWAGEGQQARPEPPPRGRAWRGLLVVALGVLLAAGALLLSGRGSSAEDVEGPERVEQESAEVEVGSCLASLPSDGGDPLDVVACEEQHLGEVVAVVELEEGEYPGEVAVLTQARERCTSAFADYVGAPVDDSGLGLLPVVPRENDWRVDGDRTVVCLAEGPALVGSVRGAAAP
jgi:hypothetical protein